MEARELGQLSCNKKINQTETSVHSSFTRIDDVAFRPRYVSKNIRTLFSHTNLFFETVYGGSSVCRFIRKQEAQGDARVSLDDSAEVPGNNEKKRKGRTATISVVLCYGIDQFSFFLLPAKIFTNASGNHAFHNFSSHLKRSVLSVMNEYKLRSGHISSTRCIIKHVRQKTCYANLCGEVTAYVTTLSVRRVTFLFARHRSAFVTLRHAR